MEALRKLAYLFFILIIAGLIAHAIEFYWSSGTFFGVIVSTIGIIGLLIVVAFHLNDKWKGRFEWRLTHIGVVAIILMFMGIIINVTCSFFFRDYIGIGNNFTTLGFIVAVIGFFVFVVKEKGFK